MQTIALYISTVHQKFRSNTAENPYSPLDFMHHFSSKLRPLIIQLESIAVYFILKSPSQPHLTAQFNDAHPYF